MAAIKKITPHLVARYRASPARRRSEDGGRVAGSTRTVCWGGITHWRSGKEWGTSSHAPRVESEGRRPGKGTMRGFKPPYLRQAHTVRRAESDGAAPCRIKKSRDGADPGGGDLRQGESCAVRSKAHHPNLRKGSRNNQKPLVMRGRLGI